MLSVEIAQVFIPFHIDFYIPVLVKHKVNWTSR
jgi:hypothetical protein